MKNNKTQPVKKYSEGDYRKAAEAWALQAFEQLVTENYKLGRYVREGLSKMVAAVEADVRGENKFRAAVHVEMTSGVYKRMATESEKRIVRGLGWEWLGDVHVLIEGENPDTYYDRAADCYDDIRFDDQMYWGAAPEFDDASAAMERYLERHGYSYPEDQTLNFPGRLEQKRVFLREVDWAVGSGDRRGTDSTEENPG